MKHFIDLDDLDPDILKEILQEAHVMKREKFSPPQIFKGLSMALMFDKRSTRTRISFDVAMKQLGGHSVMLNKEDIHLGATETIQDTANVISRFVDVAVIRVSSHDTLLEMAKHSSIPIVNAMTDHSHPCQTMADIMTIEEKLGSAAGKKIAWFGDFTNVTISLAQVAKVFDYDMVIAAPEEGLALQRDFDRVSFTDDAVAAAKDADVIVTDTWESMGQEGKTLDPFMPYQVNANLMKHAKDTAIFMHCMPMHRGDEVTNQVADSAQSVVYDEAENRLHVQKSILAYCLEDVPVQV